MLQSQVVGTIIMPAKATREQLADNQSLSWCQQKLRVADKTGLKIAEMQSWIITREWFFFKWERTRLMGALPRDNIFAITIKYLEVSNSKYR